MLYCTKSYFVSFRNDDIQLTSFSQVLLFNFSFILGRKNKHELKNYKILKRMLNNQSPNY